MQSQNHSNRLIIPTINVDAPIFEKKILANGVLQEPDTPDDIVYHDFGRQKRYGGRIGYVGNAIFTGHVDSGFQYCNYGTTPPPCKAVLWDLDRIKKGSLIKITFNKKMYIYKAYSSIQIYHEGWIDCISRGEEEIITIITCAGSFNSKTHSYDSYQTIKARRIK